MQTTAAVASPVANLENSATISAPLQRFATSRGWTIVEASLLSTAPKHIGNGLVVHADESLKFSHVRCLVRRDASWTLETTFVGLFEPAGRVRRTRHSSVAAKQGPGVCLWVFCQGREAHDPLRHNQRHWQRLD